MDFRGPNSFLVTRTIGLNRTFLAGGTGTFSAAEVRPVRTTQGIRIVHIADSTEAPVAGLAPQMG